MTEARALAIVEAALAHEDGEARARFVAGACAGDAALQARVEALLALDGSDAAFLHTDSFARAFGLSGVVAERIGPWRVTGDIARGGMGTVVRAERDDGLFEQTVAIKLLRADIASAAARARFVEERRFLARLSHPAIVRIIDGGEHLDHPWLAMDFIDGAPVTRALDARGAGRAERLRAFRAICEAVAYAHRALVVHADIKPGNVLMDAQGGVHLLDFGIAALAEGLADDAGAPPAPSGSPGPLTRVYAAPERRGGGPPTVAGDVFSLGMLLVELVAGRPPLGDRPCVPGTRLPAGWLDGDLGAIAGRALAVSPAARYPDVAALIEDLRRLDAHEPLAARAGAGWTYPAGLFVRRHWRGLALAGAAFALLAGTTVATTVLYRRAEAARALADARFAETRGAARFLIGTLLPRLEATPGTLALRAETIATAQGYLGRLTAQGRAPADLRLELADGLLQLARVQARPGNQNLARPAQAMDNLRAAERLLTPMAQPAARDLLARVLYAQVATLQWMAGDVGEAGRVAARADAVMRLLRAPSRALVRERAMALADLAGWRGDFPAEARAADAGLAAIGTAHDAADLLARFSLAGNRAEAVYYTQGAAAALPFYRARAALLGDLARSDAGAARILANATVAGWDLGTVLIDLGQPQAALAELARAEAAARRAVALDADDAEAVRRLRVVRNAQGQALARAGQLERALALFAAVRADDEALARAAPAALRRRDIAYDLTLPGEALDAAGHKARACTADRAARAAYAALRRDGMITGLDSAGNLKLVEQRIARNCPRS